jgi:hypothetical protein
VAVGNLLVTGITWMARLSSASAKVRTFCHDDDVYVLRGPDFVVAIVFSIIAAFYRYRDAATSPKAVNWRTRFRVARHDEPLHSAQVART